MPEEKPKQSIWRKGLPYEPDVKRLEEAFPIETLTEGRIIKHEEMSKIIKLEVACGRYYALINSWIKKMRNENNISLLWKPSIGVFVAQPHELLHHSEHRIRKGIRGTIRGVKSLAYVDRERLDDDGQKRLDHIMNVALRLRTQDEQAKKELPIELPAVKSLPKKKIE